MKPTCRELLDWMKNATKLAKELDLPGGPVGIPSAQLAARVERVLALHVVHPDRVYGSYCKSCHAKWPCPTVRILDGEEDK
jgi:hypothetical protein